MLFLFFFRTIPGMVKTEKEQHQDLLKQSVEHLESRGFIDIKADMAGFESPKSFIVKRTGKPVTPDITATKDGQKYFFELSLKSEAPTLLKSKWLFLDTLSRMRSNRFRIITFKGHYKFTDSLLAELNLGNKEPIKLT